MATNVLTAGATRQRRVRGSHARHRFECARACAGAEDAMMPRLEGSSTAIAVLGDLHLTAETMPAFEEAREQFQGAFQGAAAGQQLVVQLGDVGTGPTSGSPAAFHAARTYLEGYGVPRHSITGNHDLEGTDFDTDEDALAAWRRAFGQHHHWARDVGPCVLVGLSTTRYRSNVLSHHEVHIDEAQLRWFEGLLRTFEPSKPVVVFTHAPPMGCGLKVIHDLHIKNRCAWLNHSVNPHAFVDLVQRHPRIRAWFSGHFHLSHNYADSIVGTHGCAFVQTGVIGPHCNRDGFRQSRLLVVSDSHCEVSTVDHEDDGRVRLDLRFAWDADEDPVPVTPDDEIVCDVSAGYICARDACSVLWHEGVRWHNVGESVLLAEQDGMLIEYDVHTFSAIGCVTLDTQDATIALRDAQGMDVTGEASGDGSCVERIEVVDAGGVVRETYKRNEWGSFFQVFQPNKWRLKRQQLAAEQAPQETLMT